MFYITYKSDGNTACKKYIGASHLIEFGKTKSSATLYYTPDTKIAGTPYLWFYTMEGIPDFLCLINTNSSCAEPEQMRAILDSMTESQAKQTFPGVTTKLEQIKLAVANKTWTSNADALFCEVCGDFETANAVRRNREEYKTRQKEDEEKKAAAEQERIEKQKVEEELAEKQRINKAEADLKAGKFISNEMFEKLAERYDISLPMKFIGWLRQWCGDISITRHTEELPPNTSWVHKYDTVYYCSKGHKSSSLRFYADKLGEAIGI